MKFIEKEISKMKICVILIGLVLGLGVGINANAANNLIINDGFENDFVGWDKLGPVIGYSGFHHSGSKYAVLGAANNCEDDLSQTVDIPATADSAFLSYWYNITSEESNNLNVPFDEIEVTIRDSDDIILEVVDSKSNLDKDSCAVSSCYHQVIFNMEDYIGQTVKIYFYSKTDGSYFTYFRIDDVRLTVIEPEIFDLWIEDIICDATAPAGMVVKLDWEDVDDITKYNIYRNEKFYINTLLDSYFHNRANLIADNAYTYQIKAVNSSGAVIAKSNIVTANIPSNICDSNEPELYCGDGECNGNEDYNSCPEDCDFFADILDIEISDSPDPFNPFLGETSTITIANVGNNPCGEITLSIENTSRSWQWNYLAPGNNLQAIWDGRNEAGNIVPAGVYSYTVYYGQEQIALSGFDKIASYLISTANAYFLNSETGTIIVLGSDCGNGIMEEGEDCDWSGGNGYSCSAGYNDFCQYCSNQCQLIKVYGPYCGDGVINNDSEQCDEDNLGGQSCELLGFDGGSLSCDDFCQVVTSGCSDIVKPECSDNEDNDGDGLVDMDDSGCENAEDDDEWNEELPGNNPPILTYSPETGYNTDPENPGIHKNKGVADKDELVFKVIYSDENDNPPVKVEVIIDHLDKYVCKIEEMVLDQTSSPIFHDGNYINGEQYIYKSVFTKGKYKYSFAASNGIAETELVEDDWGYYKHQFTTGYSNVAFLPGTKGSRLYLNDDQSSKLWEPTNFPLDVAATFLQLTASGESVNAIYAKDIIGSVPVNTDIYGNFISFMDDLVLNDYINLWKALPYDWRLYFDDIIDNGQNIGDDRIIYTQDIHSSSQLPYFKDELLKLAENSDSGKVTIIAHSMGGLIIKRFLAQSNNCSEDDHKIIDMIDKVILVASPQVGTPQAVAGLLHADKENIGLLGSDVIISKDAALILGKHMPSAYALLPSEQYFKIVRDYYTDQSWNPFDSTIVDYKTNVVEFDERFIRPKLREILIHKYAADWVDTYGTEISAYEEFRDFLLANNIERPTPDCINSHCRCPNTLNSSILNKASNLHSDSVNGIDTNIANISNIDFYQIVGSGIQTARGLKYIPHYGYGGGSSGWYYSDYSIMHTNDGDGVVVMPSAAAMDVPTYYVNLGEYNLSLKIASVAGPVPPTREHASIMGSPMVKSIIRSVLFNDGLINNQEIILPGLLAEKLITNTPPNGLDKIFISVYSPVTIGAYDSQGNFTGIIYDNEIGSSTVYEEILGSSYYEIGEGKYISLDSDQEYQIVMEGMGDGYFTFFAEEVSGMHANNSITYSNILVTPKMKAIIELNLLDEGNEMKIDYDGDGEFDEVIIPSSEFHSNANLETQIAITKMIYDEIDILNQVTQDIGDNQAPLLLSELKESIVDLEDYTLNKKLESGQKKKLKMKFKFLETAGNEYQGKGINVKFKFLGTQKER